MELPQKKNGPNIVDEFAVLANNLIPTNLKQAEWICSEVERLTLECPELKEKFLEWRTMSESETKALEQIINYILVEADRTRQKNGESLENTF